MPSLRHLVVSLTWGLAVGVQAHTPSRIQPRASLTKRDTLPPPDPTICGDIIDVVNNEGGRLFYASDAYDCLRSVPFVAGPALRFIDYWNTTIQFHSTLGYLKNPPAGYQQPPVDVFAQLERIRQNITAGVYKNQYLFEADLQNVVYRMKDSHVDLSAGILSVFSFASPFNLVSASIDGKQEPKVYLRADILKKQQGVKFDPSPIESINGQETIAYLTRLAKLNSVGMLEPHAEWNTLMSTPSLTIQALPNILSGEITFYPGDVEHGDELTFKFANGSIPDLETFWTAHYTEPYYTGPLTTGGDFYNYFVLGHRPASYDENQLPPAFQRGGRGPKLDTLPDPGPWVPWNETWAYPKKPDVVQQNLAVSGGGVVSGYFLRDVSTGVLVIPSFHQTGWDIGNFSQATADFINGALTEKLGRVVIDLQDNYGGLAHLAFVLFKQFFPSEIPYAGSRIRAHTMANVLGQTWTKHWNSLPQEHEDWDELMASPWVITPKLNAETNKTFKSWAEFYGPKRMNGDDFSLVERYDLSNKDWSAANFAGWYATEYTDEATKPPPATPFKPKDIVILTNGICASTCSLFVEMMQAVGVRTLAVGGLPKKGPMQTASGSRGAEFYEAGHLDYDIDGALDIVSEGAHRRILENRDTGMLLHHAGFSIRHQVRENDDVPLQFKFLPADCRLYYTLANSWNMSALWRDVSRAAFTDPSMCVEGSTGRGPAAKPEASGNSTAAITKPTIALAPALNFDIDYRPDGSNDLPEPLQAGKSGPTKNITMTACVLGTACKTKGLVCEEVTFKCPKGNTKSQGFCVPLCNSHNTYCPSSTNGGTLKCGNYQAPAEKGNTVKTLGSVKRPSLDHERPVYPGNCYPIAGNRALGC